jgi:O-methyltransferase/8-demethyl-8-(2,3-dimethoxy-alpha-L-rhamnosyl)tetracenomycin-C 4'-O-methyltransferase
MTAASQDRTGAAAYIELLKRAVSNYLYLGDDASFDDYLCATRYDTERAQWTIDPLARPLTLLTKSQLDLIEEAVLVMVEQRVPGDLIEAGVWRGGAVILMRALLDAYGIADRKVFAADSFSGIPPNVRAINDPVDSWSDRWIATLDEVRQNVARFGLLDDRIVFVPGFFDCSLRTLADRRFALIRLDSDSYDSIETSLAFLYPLLSRSGMIIIDDWHLAGCRMAVHDYRSKHGIEDPILEDAGNAFWLKSQEYGYPLLR